MEKREGHVVVQPDINHMDGDDHGFYLLPQDASSHDGSLGLSLKNMGVNRFLHPKLGQSALERLNRSGSLQKHCPGLSGYSKDLTVTTVVWTNQDI